MNLVFQGATALFQKLGTTDGIFIIRKSSKGKTYALSLCHEQQIFHYEIKVLVRFVELWYDLKENFVLYLYSVAFGVIAL